MKTSEKLYNLNATISALFIATQSPMPLNFVEKLNLKLGEIIKEIRILEE